MAITFTNIGLAEPSTVTARVASVQIARGSTNEQQEILVIGDPESSLALARVLAAAPDSTHFGQVVRQVGYVAPSTDVRVSQSTYTDLNALVRLADRDQSTQVVNVTNTTPASTAYGLVVREAVPQSTTVTIRQSTAADLQAQVTQASTVWAVQIPSTQSVQVKNSTIGDLLASVQQNSTVWQTQSALRTSSGGNLEGSTASPAHGALGLHVRQVPSSMATFAASTVGATSTNTSLVSSVAGSRIKVYAFSVTSTVTSASTVSFRSSLAGLLWPVVLGSGSSGAVGANLAVAPPAFLFATDVGTALTFHTPSSGPEFHVAASYFIEP